MVRGLNSKKEEEAMHSVNRVLYQQLVSMCIDFLNF
jgi:hypothetical protein